MFRRHSSHIRISGGFWLVAGWFGWGCGWDMLSCVLLSAAVHELGHWMVLRLFGIPVRSIRLYALGAVMETDTAHLSYGREVMAVLAGPVSNFLFAAALCVWDERRFGALAGANLILCVFNLIPLRPLDGGRACHLLLTFWFGTGVGERISALLDRIFGVLAGGLLCMIAVLSCGSLWLMPMAGAFMAAAFGIKEKDRKSKQFFCKKSLHL